LRTAWAAFELTRVEGEERTEVAVEDEMNEEEVGERKVRVEEVRDRDRLEVGFMVSRATSCSCSDSAEGSGTVARGAPNERGWCFSWGGPSGFGYPVEGEGGGGEVEWEVEGGTVYALEREDEDRDRRAQRSLFVVEEREEAEEMEKVDGGSGGGVREALCWWRMGEERTVEIKEGKDSGGER
jgi:hypothetical protein